MKIREHRGPTEMYSGNETKDQPTERQADEMCNSRQTTNRKDPSFSAATRDNTSQP